MGRVSLFTSDGLYIGCESLPSRDEEDTHPVPDSHGEKGRLTRDTTEQHGLLEREGDQEAEQIVTPAEGAQLLTLYRLFLQLHKPQLADTAGGGGDAYHLSHGGGWGSGEEEVEDEDEELQSAHHSGAYPSSSALAVPYPAFLEPSGRFNQPFLLDGWRPSVSHGAGTLCNPNRSATGAEEWPLRVGLVRDAAAGEEGDQTPADGLASVELTLETTQREMSCRLGTLPYHSHDEGQVPAIRLDSPLVFCCHSTPSVQLAREVE